MQMSSPNLPQRWKLTFLLSALVSPAILSAQQVPSDLLKTPLPSAAQAIREASDSPRYSSSLVATVDPEMDFKTGAASSNATQPPPRRTYGRPRYADSMHNADGSRRYTFAVGGGFDVPAGATGRYQTLSWRVGAGGGINFNKTFGVLVQWDYDRFGVPGSVLRQIINAYEAAGFDATGLDGNAHIWSITLNPIINYYTSDTFGAYVIGGGGFYRKITNFTLPTQGVYCTYYGICYQVTQNQVVEHYSNNAGGASLGLGFTRKVSRFSDQKLFAEARYVWVANQFSPTNTLYPPNNYRTGYFPVTVGLRW